MAFLIPCRALLAGYRCCLLVCMSCLIGWRALLTGFKGLFDSYDSFDRIEGSFDGL